MSDALAIDVAEILEVTPAPVAVRPVCSLDCIRKGERIEIISVNDQHARVQALRFGMAEGACVECVTRVPAGPLVIKSGRQEIAVGRELAKRISVRRLA